MSKDEKIKAIVAQMIDNSVVIMKSNIDKALSCGALDVDSWDEKFNPMILPKVIAIAVLQREAEQYDGKGTCFEKQVKKEVKNLRCFI